MLGLEAEGDVDVAEALDAEAVEELGGEVDGEVAAEGEELSGQRGLVERRDEADQLLDLVGLQHVRLSSHLARAAGDCAHAYQHERTIREGPPSDKTVDQRALPDDIGLEFDNLYL